MLLLFLGYHLEVTKRTLAEAKAFCNNLGQKLFEPKSLEANSEVNELAKPHVLTGPYDIISIWIGIQDKISEGNFVYVSSNATIVYENWNPTEPNNWGGGEHCAIMGMNGGKWYDLSCDNDVSFVCEKSGELNVIELVIIIIFVPLQFLCKKCRVFSAFLTKKFPYIFWIKHFPQ